MDFGLDIWISIFAVLVSFVSFAVTFWQRRASDVTGVKPALVFVFDNAGGWRLQNVGNGPALNIVVARKRPHGEWFDPVRVPPIPRDGEFELRWVSADDENGLGATYNDIRDRPYTTTTGDDYSRISAGDQLPERIVPAPHPKFEADEVRVYWALPDARGSE